MNKKIFFSCRMDFLLERLLKQFEIDPIKSLETRTIFVPNGQIKQWLLLEIAKRTGIAMGLKILEVERFSPAPLEIFCLLYSALSASTDPEVKEYLGGKRKRILDLSDQLTHLFFAYGQFAPELFEPKNKTHDWQQALLQKIFVEGSWKMAVQILPEIQPKAPVICFGIDFLPPVYWEYFSKAPSLSIYIFSPCAHYWEDVCSDRERIKLNHYWQKKGTKKAIRDQLDDYLRQAPKNLANWGKLGRESLKIFDRYDFEMEENYPFLEPNFLLKQIQFDLLSFQQTKSPAIDSSIKIFLTGSSRLKEIECLRDEILRLNVPFHEISVLVPHIEPYVPLIEFVFAETIPYRISGFDIAPQSAFQQGLGRLLHLASHRWDAEEVLTLFETPAFYRKQGWDEEKLQIFRSWISAAKIKWGRDAVHRDAILSATLGTKGNEDQSSWEKGLDRLLEALVYVSPLQINADLFEEFLVILAALKKLPLSGEKPLAVWADHLEFAAKEFLMADADDEADIATQSCFREFLQNLRMYPEQRSFPFSVIQHLLMKPCAGQIHASHLHAVRFSPIDEGALIPAKAIFLIGMDEENFPRLKTSSSLNLLKGKIPDQAEKDRYYFLQAIFSASDYLRISYGHLSPDEGKPVGPSLLVQELISTIGEGVTTVYKSIPFEPKREHFSWNMHIHPELPEGEWTVSISDLRQLARHPWKFFLQKVHGIYLNESIDNTFALQRGQLVRAALGKPLEEVLNHAELPEGILGKALRLEVIEKASEWQQQLEEWQIQPFSLLLRENCREKLLRKDSLVAPAIELVWNRLKVRIVGEIKQVSLKGLICANDDHISGLLKVWPEALVAAVSLNAPHIWMLKSGKTKQLEDPTSALKLWVEYYFSCLVTPSPLLPDWADPLLRKGPIDLGKKMEKGSNFEDPVLDWVLGRTEIPSSDQIFNEWNPYFKEKLCSLIALYPTRSKSHAAV